MLRRLCCSAKRANVAPASTSAAAQATALGAKSTADDVIKAFVKEKNGLRGRNILVTGATKGGIGFESARALASAGAHVMLACPLKSMCDEAEKSIKDTMPEASVSSLVLDLGDLKAVRSAAAEVVRGGKPLHVLINNAGLMAMKRKTTRDGIELNFGVNFLGGFYFTNELLPALRAGAPSRVVNVASSGHWMFARDDGIAYDDLNAEKGYKAYERYGMSKLAVVLGTKEFSRRHAGEGVVAVCLHPGMIGSTHISASAGAKASDMIAPFTYGKFWKSMLTEAQKDIPQGAATTVYAALAPGVVPGGYYSQCALETERVHRLNDDAAQAQKLWNVSNDLIAAALAKA